MLTLQSVYIYKCSHFKEYYQRYADISSFPFWFSQDEIWFFFQTFLFPIAQHSFFYKFIHNYIVFEAKFFVYTKGSHYADIFSSLLPIFFRRRNEFSFQTLLCLVLLIAHHSVSTNSFTIASFLRQNSNLETSSSLRTRGYN